MLMTKAPGMGNFLNDESRQTMTLKRVVVKNDEEIVKERNVQLSEANEIDEEQIQQQNSGKDQL